MREVTARLQIPAADVIFGHTHRAGPLPGDALEAWRTASGTRLWNSGSWLFERAFLGWEPQASPYRPGFCVLVPATGHPQLLNLLDRAKTGPVSGYAGREADRVAADPR
jgi:hypothetical protein